MKPETVRILKEKMGLLFTTEIAGKLEKMEVSEYKDRLRIIFEFEFKGKDYIRDAVEIRHRRPWR